MKKQELNTLYHCVYSLTYHLVLVTKYRRRIITSAMLGRLEIVFRETLTKWGCTLEEFNGEPDHVHLLISLTPTVQPSKLVNNLKTVTSRLIRKEFGPEVRQAYGLKRVFWSRSYCLVTRGGAPLEVIKRYIEQQAGTE